jgi:trigger factor
MKLDLKNKNDFSRVLKITATWGQIKDDYYQEFSKAKLQYQIPGFRKGRVPDNIIKKNLTPSIESKFIDHYVNVYYRKGLEELKLVPINQGNIIKIDFKESSNLEFEIAFEVRPEIKMPKYKNKVKIKTQKYIAGDQDLKDSLLDLQTRFAKTQTVEGNVKDGYFIYADFDKLNAEGNVVEGSTLKNHFIKIGEGMFSGEIGDKFIGKKAGDAVNVSITQDKGPIDYHVKVNRVEEQILPGLNDEFAKTVDENFKTMKELNDSLLDKIQDNLNQENIKEFHNKIIDYFIDKTSFDIPDSMVENYKSHLTEEYKKQYTHTHQEFDESKLAETLIDTAKKTVQWILIRDLLISDEGIRVVEEEISNYIKEQSVKNPEHKKDIKKYYLEDQNRYKLHEDMTNQKLYESLGAYFSNVIKESSTSKLRKNKKG